MNLCRVTLTPFLRGFQWRSDALINDTWHNIRADDIPLDFIEHMKRLDTQEYPAVHPGINTVTLRALYGLPNSTEAVKPIPGDRSIPARRCWTTLLRFQVLDLLISLNSGVSEILSAKAPLPIESTAVESSQPILGPVQPPQLARPSHDVQKAAKECRRKIDKIWATAIHSNNEKPSSRIRQHGVRHKHIVIKDVPKLTSHRSGDLVDYEGTVASCQAASSDIAGPNKTIAEVSPWLDDETIRALKGMTIYQLLTPLAAALGFSPLLALCKNLSKGPGNMFPHLHSRNFLGRHRTPKLAHIESAIFNVVSAIARGQSLQLALTTYMDPAISTMPCPNPEDTSIFACRTKSHAPSPPMPPPEPLRPNVLMCPSLSIGTPSTSSMQYGEGLLSMSPAPEPPSSVMASLPWDAQGEAGAADIDHFSGVAYPPDGTSDIANGAPSAQEPQFAALNDISGRVERSESPLTVMDESPPPTPGLGPTNNSHSTDVIEPLDFCQSVVGMKGNARKRGDSSSGGQPSKRRKTCECEPATETNCLCSVEAQPPKRSEHPVVLRAYRPDGFTHREFQWVGHSTLDAVEQPMLQSLQASMDRTDARCTKDGRRFRHYTPGQPAAPAAEDEFDLFVITEEQWKTMSKSERVDIWGTGSDIFVFGLGVNVNGAFDAEESLSSLHRLDQLMEVQVPGLRIPPSAEEEGDYTKVIRITSVRTFIGHAKDPDGLVLNALSLPETHNIWPNALAGRHVDPHTMGMLSLTTYQRQTNNLDGFPQECLPNEHQFWQIAGTPHTLTIDHIDKAPTRITVLGPEEKLWIRRRRNKCERDIGDLESYTHWDPDQPDLQASYEGVILPPNAGTLLMQGGTEHIVVGLPPEGHDGASGQFMGTLITGGHFNVASRIRDSLCTLLHLVMLEHLLTNVSHDGLWQIQTRILAFWTSVTVSPSYNEDRHMLEPYLPRLSEKTCGGWMDIVCVASIVLLAAPFDRRRKGIPPNERKQRTEAGKLYSNWRTWFAQSFVGTSNGVEVDWERDVFTAVLVHLALVLARYHEKQHDPQSGDGLLKQTNAKLAKEIGGALDAYRKGLAVRRTIRQPPEDGRPSWRSVRWGHPWNTSTAGDLWLTPTVFAAIFSTTQFFGLPMGRGRRLPPLFIAPAVDRMRGPTLCFWRSPVIQPTDLFVHGRAPPLAQFQTREACRAPNVLTATLFLPPEDKSSAFSIKYPQLVTKPLWPQQHSFGEKVAKPLLTSETSSLPGIAKAFRPSGPLQHFLNPCKAAGRVLSNSFFNITPMRRERGVAVFPRRWHQLRTPNASSTHMLFNLPVRRERGVEALRRRRARSRTSRGAIPPRPVSYFRRHSELAFPPHKDNPLVLPSHFLASYFCDRIVGHVIEAPTIFPHVFCADRLIAVRARIPVFLSLVTPQEKVSQNRPQIYYRGEVAFDYSTSSKKWHSSRWILEGINREEKRSKWNLQLGSRFADAGEEDENTRTDTPKRTNISEAPIFPVVLPASGAAANAARRAGEKVEVDEPLSMEVRIAAVVVLAPREDILGHAELHSERALELGLRDGPDVKSVVDRETAVSEMQRGLVARIGTTGNDAEGARAFIVNDVGIDLPLGDSTETAGSEGGGGAAGQGGGAGHGVGGRARNARTWRRNVVKSRG
ncbi:hypothetical protein B0H16DRAFT_1458464 [Mycena metata]|uniref:Uncharacterized protein n=1 Tax=Mycena metata TaxID=1033252 RepID=A0AAD7J2W7_9AGAR|nr:hypothetical protein B0H16DRAFT_1458464 [Mycena metata]